MSDNPTVDQVVDDEKSSDRVEEHLKSRSTWFRLLYMCIFGVFASLAGMVGTVIVVLGFLWVLFTGEVNRELRQVGQSIADYLYQIFRFLTYNTDDKPFPFGLDWPGDAGEGGA